MSVRLLIVAAMMFFINGVDYAGFDLSVCFAPATKTTPRRMEWQYEAFSFNAWHDDPAGSVIHVAVCATFIALLLLIAWGVRRARRWVAVLGIVVSSFLAVGLIVASVFDSIAFVRGAWFLILQSLWTISLGVILLIVAARLWSVCREVRTASSPR